jgi:hypothetical protein
VGRALGFEDGLVAERIGERDGERAVAERFTSLNR